jgi:hypothetical protein
MKIEYQVSPLALFLSIYLFALLTIGFAVAMETLQDRLLGSHATEKLNPNTPHAKDRGGNANAGEGHTEHPEMVLSNL